MNTPALNNNEVENGPNQQKPLGTVVYCEPSLLIREAISTLIKNQFKIDSIVLAGDSAEAIQKIQDLGASLLVTEIALPGRSGIELLHELKRININIPSIVITGVEEEHVCKQAFLAGAKGYLLKSEKAEDLGICINEVVEGGSYVSDRFKHVLSGSKLVQASARDSVSGDEFSIQSDPLRNLSPREREIFHLLTGGFTNIVIANKLLISRRTVETHRAKIVQKLKVNNNAELIHYAMKNGLVVFN